MTCEVDDCKHELFDGGPTCACHIDVEDYKNLSRELQVEAVRIAALENDAFDVSVEGDIRLKEEGDG